MGGDGHTSDDAAFGMDLDLEPSHSRSRPSPVRGPSRFQPKLKGKLKGKPIDASATATIASGSVPMKKQEIEDVAVVKKDVIKEEPAGPAVALDGLSDEGASQMMDIDYGEDTIIEEIDVFWNPSLDDRAKLYVMQYPLRPAWRPYELNEGCEVRVDPKHSKVEVDLVLDIDSENFDNEVAEPSLNKLTLSSSDVPFATQYAVGVLTGNKLYLNPVHAVVQLRPLMERRDSPAEQKKTNSVQMVSEDSHQDTDGAESWIPLNYLQNESSSSLIYHQKMVSASHDDIPFMMTPSNYVNSLCPGTSSDSKRANGLSKRMLTSMPLDDRLKKWLSEGPQVNRFDALMHLTTNEPVNEVLEVVQRYADLVQGLWVSKSSLLCKDDQKALARDYFLFLLSKSHVVPSSKLDGIKLLCDPSTRKELISPLAVKGPSNSWKLKEASDVSFIEKYPDIVKNQESVWSKREKLFSNLFQPVGKSKATPIKSSVGASSKVDPSVNRSRDSSATGTISTETGEALQKVLQQVLRFHKFCSPSMIVQGLREVALALSSKNVKVDRKNPIAEAALCGATAPFSEIQPVLERFAINIHGVYVSKALGGQDASFDALRGVVIELFCQREPGVKLKKQEVQQAAQIRLLRDITEIEFSKVMGDLCDSVDGEWGLKRADWRRKQK